MRVGDSAMRTERESFIAPTLCGRAACRQFAEAPRPFGPAGLVYHVLEPYSEPWAPGAARGRAEGLWSSASSRSFDGSSASRADHGARAVRTYESDGLTGYRVVPGAVVLPTTTEQVQGVVRVCHRERIPFVARGNATGLSGGALPVAGGIVIGLARMNRILEVDIPNARVVVNRASSTLHVTAAGRQGWLLLRPDPSSQSVCTIGGNVAENSGGAHCLKYGFTTNHVLGLTVVLPTARSPTSAARPSITPGYDLIGVFVGAEGTLGIATEVTLRLVRRPEAVQMVMAAFHSTDHAGGAVSDIIGAGMLPAAIEMMDHLSIQAVEQATHAGYPTSRARCCWSSWTAPRPRSMALIDSVEEICRRNQAWEVRRAKTAAERLLMWKGRRRRSRRWARISPSYYVQDGVMPRTALPRVLRRIDELSREYGMRVANVFHAWGRQPPPAGPVRRRGRGRGRARRGAGQPDPIACIDNGGSITGEHGVGDRQKEVHADECSAKRIWRRCTWSVRLRSGNSRNPTKLFPTPRLCGERPGPARPHPLVAAGLAEIF